MFFEMEAAPGNLVPAHMGMGRKWVNQVITDIMIQQFSFLQSQKHFGRNTTFAQR